ncbi:MAG: DUF1289 domain-containing protein [Alphaproteobacteria bacterium]|nr:DUF1289 domain-containing protein [Alphaproteobacteria bacterium]
MTDSAFPLVSPCVGLCALEGSGTYCIGCFRTRAEIAGWSAFSDDDKKNVLTALHERRTQWAQQNGQPLLRPRRQTKRGASRSVSLET